MAKDADEGARAKEDDAPSGEAGLVSRRRGSQEEAQAGHQGGKDGLQGRQKKLLDAAEKDLVHYSLQGLEWVQLG